MDALSTGGADVPPRVAAKAPGGWLGAMPGYLDGVGLAAKLVTIFADNVDVPSHQGLITLFDLETGTPLAIIDAEVITEERTAMTAAVAADLLARPEAEVLTIVGGGAQATAHARAFAGIRPWREVRAVNRSQPAAVVVAGEAREAGVPMATVFEEFGPAVDGADVVALCTHADGPVIDASRITAGTHVSSVGSRAELPIELAKAGRVVVEWKGAVDEAPPAGAVELQALDRNDVVELGDVIGGREPGRRSATEITVYKSTGHAVQDVAAARLIYDAAVAAGVGAAVTV